MKGVLNEKELKSRFSIETYEDGETEIVSYGDSKTITVELLDVLISMFLSQDINKDGRNNEAIAESVRCYMLSTMNMVVDKMKEEAKNDLC